MGDNSRSRRRIAHVGLESFYGSLLCLLPVDIRFGVAQFLEFFFAESVVGRKDRLTLDIFQLWYPYAESVSDDTEIVPRRNSHFLI